MRRPRTGLALLVAALPVMHGCADRSWVHDQRVGQDASVVTLDTDGDGQADYWQRLDAQGRKVELAWDTTADGEPDHTVRPDEIPADACLHVIFVLDGVPFDVVDELYRKGRFRLFPPPSRVISVFPAMTDLVLTQVFTDETCLGYEASYYDRGRGKPSSANQVYLSGANAPWVSCMDYRCNLFLDTKCYLDPKGLWQHEMGKIRSKAEARQTGTLRAYSVATAGLGTRGGREAIVAYLKTVDAFCEQLMYERRGRVRFTLFADHGHDLVAARKVDFEPPLEAAGFRLADGLRTDADVFWPRYGLISNAVFYTHSAAQVSDVLVEVEGVDLVVYPATRGLGEQSIVVRQGDQMAWITYDAGRFRYETVRGDPLRLVPVVEQLRIAGKLAPDRSADDRDWFAATAEHDYPDALWRIWFAFNGLVENPADVIASLHAGYFCGSGFFSSLVDVASTHGSLARRSSTTFVLSNQTRFPPVLRAEDLGPVVRPK
jgi:hypothetical protein